MTDILVSVLHSWLHLHSLFMTTFTFTYKDLRTINGQPYFSHRISFRYTYLPRKYVQKQVQYLI